MWDGGDPDCDHINEQAARPQRDNNGGLVNNRIDTRGEQSWTQGSAGPKFNASCGKCGARRVDQQIGLEDTPDQWVERLVAVFREVRRVLRDDGTLWVEIGDSYGSGGHNGKDYVDGGKTQMALAGQKYSKTPYKHKDLLGQPWLLAFALRADGWYLRSEIIWARPNPMPESVTDRPTKSHSTVFLLSKQPRYFYDADAIREPSQTLLHRPNYKAVIGNTTRDKFGAGSESRRTAGKGDNGYVDPAGANARSVWQIPTQPTPFAHFATWPEALVRRMILAGTSERGCCPECGAPWLRETEVDPAYAAGVAYANERRRAGAKGAGADGLVNANAGNLGPGAPRTKTNVTLGWSPSCAHDTPPVPCTVLDPFAGSATTCLVARNHGRHSIGIELNADYLQIAAKRLQQLSLLSGGVT